MYSVFIEDESGMIRAVLLAILMYGQFAFASSLQVAVASNFQAPAKEIAALYTFIHGTQVNIITGSTGKLFAQITNGAPYDVFLAADSERPERLIAKGLADAASRQTYAIGRVVVWTSARLEKDELISRIKDGSYKHIAIANPRLAPYGVAARAALQSLGVWKVAKSRLVVGENIGQTFQFVRTRNADFGFVALSQVIQSKTGTFVPFPEAGDVRQIAVVLSGSNQVNRGKRFLDWLTSSKEVQSILARHGYRTQKPGVGL
jgi:molybdate transport system substrate-binding protein